MDMHGAGNDAKRYAGRAGVTERGTAHGSPLHRLGQVGYAAQGLVWIVVGWFAFLAARGAGSQEATSSGALEALRTSPVGVPLLVVMALGLACYALRQGVEAAVGHRSRSGRTRTAKRVGSGGKAVLGAVLAVSAVGLVVGSGGGDGGGEEQGASTVLALPGGQLLLGLVGLGIIAAGAYWIWSGATAHFEEKLDRGAPSWVVPLGRVGHVAKGVAVGVLGVLFVLAAWRSDPSEAGGTDSAFALIGSLPAGPWLLGAVGLGLVGFGLYQIASARYLREG